MDREDGVSHLVEYLLISGILLLILVIIIPMVNVIFIEGPTNQLTNYAFIDIGNGVSTRIVDLYAIIPYYNNASISTKYDIPDDIVGRDYRVEIVPGPPSKSYDNQIVISGNNLEYEISLAGIGATVFGLSGGNTTASGVNRIEYCYNLSGGCPS